MKKSELKELVREVLVETQEETTVESITRSDLKDMIKKIISEGKIPKNIPPDGDKWWTDQAHNLIKFATVNNLWPVQYSKQAREGKLMKSSFEGYVKKWGNRIAFLELMDDLEYWVELIPNKRPKGWPQHFGYSVSVVLPDLSKTKKKYGGRFDPKLESMIPTMIEYAYDNHIIRSEMELLGKWAETWRTRSRLTTKEVFDDIIVSKFNQGGNVAPGVTLNSMKKLEQFVGRRTELWDMVKYIRDTYNYDSNEVVVVPAFRWDETDYSEKETDSNWFDTVQHALHKQGIDIDMQKVRTAWWQGNGLKVLKSLLKKKSSG